ncbi:MAG TPA: hypothetical protein VFI54_08055 [Solirubrobacteraceae bacterium]|nr:hypothetical protein [Solirubrobacteraceae bacterium]
MKRFRIAVVAGLATLALGATAVPVASASNGTAVPPKTSSLPALTTVPVHGVAKNGKQFNGSYAIQRYVARGNKVYAVGTLKGKLKGRHVTRYNVMMPATLSGPAPAGAAKVKTAQVACTVLQLQLGPIDLNLLGLRVQLFGGTNPASPLPVSLLITGVPGDGNLLGNLLCSLTGALNQPGVLGQLNNNLSQLTATLTSLTSLLGAL